MKEAHNERKAVAGDKRAGEGHGRSDASRDAAVENSDADELRNVGDEAGEHEDEGPGGVGTHEHGFAAIGVGEVSPEGACEAHKKGENAGRGAGPECCVGRGLDTELLLDEEGVEGLHERPADGCDPLREANQSDLPFPAVQTSHEEEGGDGGFGEGAH